MRRLQIGAWLIAFVCTAAVSSRAQVPNFPTPTKEHKWLDHLVGEWKTNAEAIAGPGQPSMKCEGEEKVRMLGGFWSIAEGSMNAPEMPMKSVMTLGYDPEKKKYIGTWVDSMTSHLWKYEGTVDETGKILTLDTEGPDMTQPGKTAKFKEKITVVDKDHKEMSSSMQGADGKWITFVTVKYERKK